LPPGNPIKKKHPGAFSLVSEQLDPPSLNKTLARRALRWHDGERELDVRAEDALTGQTTLLILLL